MMKILHFLYWKQKAEYESRYSMPETSEHLKNAVEFGWSPIRGTVTTDKIDLYHRNPFWNAGFSLIFRGRLEYSGDTVVLSDAYSLRPSVKYFHTLWIAVLFLFLLLETVLVLIQILIGEINPEKMISMYSGPIALLLSSYLGARMGASHARNDVDHLSRVIKDALE
jgi:hypothetical protein